MKTLYLDCSMGAAGDMLTAALYELLDEAGKAAFLKQMNALGLPNIAVASEPMIKCGILGTHMKVTVGGVEEDVLFHDHDHEHEHHHHEHDHEHHDHEHHDHEEHCHEHSHEQEHDHAHEENCHEHTHHHHHSSMNDIAQILSALPLSERVRADAAAVYQEIAEAESVAHNAPVDQIHFHEVGTLDAVADVTAVCLLMELLGVEKVLASPVHVGSGQVQCAHGILPVPAPATAYILREVPIYGGSIRGELCTPTGAALLKHFVSAFGEMPLMKVQKIGYGMGKKDFPAANCVRALLGETADTGDQILELSCNLDDMTPEHIGFAMEQLFAAGALDVYTVPVGMKKSRPGVLLSVLCTVETREAVLAALFRHTTTLGVRENAFRRYTLRRSFETVETPYGSVQSKTAEGYGVTRRKYEYDDLARIAAAHGLTLDDVIRAADASRK